MPLEKPSNPSRPHSLLPWFSCNGFQTNQLLSRPMLQIMLWELSSPSKLTQEKSTLWLSTPAPSLRLSSIMTPTTKSFWPFLKPSASGDTSLKDLVFWSMWLLITRTLSTSLQPKFSPANRPAGLNIKLPEMLWHNEVERYEAGKLGNGMGDGTGDDDD